MVITISLAIIGMIGLLTGTMLYGFGRTIEEINHLQPIQGEPKKKGIGDS